MVKWIIYQSQQFFQIWWVQCGSGKSKYYWRTWFSGTLVLFVEKIQSPYEINLWINESVLNVIHFKFDFCSFCLKISPWKLFKWFSNSGYNFGIFFWKTERTSGKAQGIWIAWFGRHYEKKWSHTILLWSWLFYFQLLPFKILNLSEIEDGCFKFAGQVRSN